MSKLRLRLLSFSMTAAISFFSLCSPCVIAVDNNISNVYTTEANGDLLSIFDSEYRSTHKGSHRLYSEENSVDSILYANSDGTKSVCFFEEPVKYINEFGKISDKSNTLYVVSDVCDNMSDYAYVTNDNDIKTFFPKSLTDNRGIIIQALDHIIELSPCSFNECPIVEENGTVLYNEVFGDATSIKYTPSYSGFKEDLILNEYSGNKFSYIIEIGDLNIVQENGSISLRKENGDSFAKISPLFVYDSDPDGSNICIDNHYSIDYICDGKYKLTMIVDDEYLKDDNTVYPVIIDPSIQINATGSGANKTIMDTPIYNGSSVSQQAAGHNSTGIIGYVNNQYGVGRLLMKFPGLASQNFWNNNYTINSATLTVKEVSGLSSSSVIQAYNYTGESWDENSTYSLARWNGVGTPINSQSFSYPDNTIKGFDITSAVRSWIGNSAALNKGIILLNNTSETDVSKRKILQTTEGVNKPYLLINYQEKSPNLIPNGVYFIRNLNSGKFLQVKDRATANYTDVVQYEYHGDKNQQFLVTYETDGYYSFRPMHVPQQSSVLDLQSESGANTIGTLCKIYTYSPNFQEQKFIVASANGNGFLIGSKVSEGTKVLEVANASMNNNANIKLQSSSNTGTNANWCFEAVNYGCAPSYSSIQTSSYNINAVGFALGINANITLSTLGLNVGASSNEVANAIISYFNTYYSNTRSIRRISGTPSDPTFYVASNEYRVAVKVSTTWNDPSDYDYDCLIQLDNGAWAHKPGTEPSEVLGFLNPTTEIWQNTFNNNTITYDSSVVYLAVSN